MTNSNNFNITPAIDGFGATLTGILLNGELSTAQVTTVIAALNQYGVVSFPDQDFTPCSLENLVEGWANSGMTLMSSLWRDLSM